MRTHEVTNQVPPLGVIDLLASYASLTEAVCRWVAPADREGAAALPDLGRMAGTAQVRTWADQSDTVTPVLRTHTPSGERLDTVEYHPAYHRLMEVAVGEGLTAEAWTRLRAPGAHARRAASFVLWSQVDAGHLCPVSMTYAAARARRRARRRPSVAARAYDPRLASVGTGASRSTGWRVPTGRRR